MPMRSQAQLEIQLRSTRSPNAQPSSEFPRTEISGSQFERLTSRRPRTRPRPCKRCVALARRKTKACSSWLSDGRRASRASQVGKNRLEARFVTQRIESPTPQERAETAVMLVRVDFQLI